MSKIAEYLTEELIDRLDFVIEMIADNCDVAKEETAKVFDELFDAGLIDLSGVKYFINALDEDNEDFE